MPNNKLEDRGLGRQATGFTDRPSDLVCDLGSGVPRGEGRGFLFDGAGHLLALIIASIWSRRPAISEAHCFGLSTNMRMAIVQAMNTEKMPMPESSLLVFPSAKPCS